MQIAQNKVASFNYTLKDDSGKVIDSSEGRQPLEYVHGSGGIIPGLESAMAGKQEGDAFHVVIPAADAYGEKSDKLIQAVPRSNFGGIPKIEVGMQFQARTPQGMHVVTVVSVDDENVTVDGNHPLAGQTLHFDVTIVGVRDAQAHELEHGHVCNMHDQGGCESCGHEH
jgi:FKBP-type peptidyl-prolyl cis-trans isomerase SlyD